MRLRRWYLIILLLLLTAGLLFVGQAVMAQDGDDGDNSAGQGTGERDEISERCLGCHATFDEGVTTTFENGDERSVHFDPSEFDSSVHGNDMAQAPLSCYDCHGLYPYPHRETWETPRDFRLELNDACQKCHTYEGGLQADSVHSLAMAQGNDNAAVCVDCHGYHNVSTPGQPRAAISQTCGNCHTEIFDVYKESVHGEALLEESNPDVPTCISCHGVHNIENPTTNLFRLKSPEICAECHADDALMEQYGISTNVFESYVADFHGTTVTLFQEQAPDAEVNKAVCYDCHGVHNIRAPEDPQSTVRPENLLQTCQKCHPEATSEFPASWLNHYEPDQEKYPIVYYVDLFYRFFIPGMLGFFAIVIVTDVGQRIFRKDEH